MKLQSFVSTLTKLIIIYVMISLSALLRLWIWSTFDVFLGFAPFYPAVMVAALWGGLYLGLFATILSDFYVYYFSFIASGFDYEVNSLITIILFCFNGIFFSLVGEHLKRARLEIQDALTNAKQLSDAMDNIPAYVYIKDLKHHYIYANKPTLELFKTSPSELISKDDYQFFPKETVERLHEIDDRVFNQLTCSQEEIATTDLEGNPRVYWEIKTPIFEQDAPNKLRGLCGISTDITDRISREDALRESEERFHSIFDAAAIGMAIVDTKGYFIQVNEALCQIVGYKAEEILKKTFMDITHPEDLDKDLDYMRQLLAGTRKSYQFEKRYFHKDGHIIWILLTGSVVHDSFENIKYFIAQILDITEQKLLLKKLEQQAHHDYLTGLYNRRFFIEESQLELQRAKRFNYQLGVMMIDIDYFKKINDLYGHKVGDAVLQHFSQLLQKAVRSFDLLARLGGEEFVIILPQMTHHEVQEIAERIRALIEANAYESDSGQKVNYTISIGVLITKNLDITIDNLLNEVDKALYKAKKTGRNRVCFEYL